MKIVAVMNIVAIMKVVAVMNVVADGFSRLSLLDCRKIVDSFSLDCVIIPGDPTWGLQLLKNRPITWTVFLKSV